MAVQDSHDLAQLSNLTEQTLLASLQDRYAEDIIYTYVGDILVAINPFCDLPLYLEDVSKSYRNMASRDDAPPHLFAIADKAHADMVRNSKPQVCVISGESGAGKTESTKIFMRHIMDVASKSVQLQIEKRILQMNPVLEAFGNAQTVMNDNSSRFGKYIELQFRNGSPYGASITSYLLERSRVISQAEGEQNFHIFGYMLGAPRETLSTYNLRANSDYRYLPEGQEPDKEGWENLANAVKEVGFNDMDFEAMLGIVASVLHIGNFDFDDNDDDTISLSNSQDVTDVASILMVDETVLRKAITTQVIDVGGELIIKTHNYEKAIQSRDAFAKALYGQAFKWLVKAMDKLLKVDESSDNSCLLQSVGILDIFGFEDFEINGFEQICINLANEQLQFYFNRHIFAMELAEYDAEGISAIDVGFRDNSQVLDMFFAKPTGLLRLLDEESRFPSSTDESLVQKFNSQLPAYATFKKLMGQGGFGIQHYAGKVVYRAAGFLEKNRDNLSPQTFSLFHSSKNHLLKHIFSENFDLTPGNSKTNNNAQKSFKLLKMLKSRRKNYGKSIKSEKSNKSNKSERSNKKSYKSKHARGSKSNSGSDTVSGKFKTSLYELIERMECCEPHFVRCIKPNNNKEPHSFEPPFVMKQLRYTGMLEATRIRREGFAFRLSFATMVQRYQGIAFTHTNKKVKPTAESCRLIIKAASEYLDRRNLAPIDGYQIGKTKIFLKYWHGDQLGQIIDVQRKACIKMQKTVRMFIAKRRFVTLLHELQTQQDQTTTFMLDVLNQSTRVFGVQMNLCDEDMRRGPDNLADQITKRPKGKKKAAVVLKDFNNKAHLKELKKFRKGAQKWWNKFERAKGLHIDDFGHIFSWFHGLISRPQTGEYLQNQSDGVFLIRVSERYDGYVLSMKFAGRVRHYRIEVSHKGMHIFGSKTSFATLAELVEYYSSVPITKNDQDRLVEPLALIHDLGLGIDDEIDDDNIDHVAHNAKRGAALKSDEPPEVPMRSHDKRGRPALRGMSAGSTMSLVFVDDDEDIGDAMPENEYFDPGSKPDWYRGRINRAQAEEFLDSQSRLDGSFLVREKLRSSKRVVFALSLCKKYRFVHHLLEKCRGQFWTIDSYPVDTIGTLNDVIKDFQRKTDPRIGVQLLKDNPVSRLLQEDEMDTQFLAKDWSVGEVLLWLSQLNMGAYTRIFQQSRIDGKKLAKMTDWQLQYYVGSVADRKQIMAAIKSMKSSLSPNQPKAPPRRSVADGLQAAQMRSNRSNSGSGSASAGDFVQMGVFRPKKKGPLNAKPAKKSLENKMPSMRRDPARFYKTGGVFGRNPPEAQITSNARAGNLKKIVQIVEANPGVDIDAVRKGGHGNTALYHAAERGWLNVVEQLLDYGADPKRRNFAGVTPIQAAMANHQHEVVVALKAAEQERKMQRQPTRKKRAKILNEKLPDLPSRNEGRSRLSSLTQHWDKTFAQTKTTPKAHSEGLNFSRPRSDPAVFQSKRHSYNEDNENHHREYSAIPDDETEREYSAIPDDDGRVYTAVPDVDDLAEYLAPVVVNMEESETGDAVYAAPA